METTNLPFRFETHERCSILCLTPHLTEVDWGDVEQVGSELLQRLDGMVTPALLVDLTQLSYMGSSQVALVVRVWKAVKGRDGRMAVQVTHPLVREVLKIAGLNALWDIVETRDQALQSLGVAEQRPGARGAIGLILGVLGLVGAAVGLYVALARPQPLSDPLLNGLRYGSAGAAALGGLWSAVGGRGAVRGLGIAIVVAAVALAAIQVLKQAHVL